MIINLNKNVHASGLTMEKELHLSENEFSLFCEVITSFHTIMDMDEMIVAILHRIQSIVEIEGASIALHDRLNKEFYFIRTVEEVHRITHADNHMMRFPDSKGVAGWVLNENTTAVINDVTQDPRYYSGFDTKREFLTRSMICVPLRTRKGFMGVLYALNKIDGEFTEREKKILEIISGTIAVSLENARLYGELKEHVNVLEREKRLLQSQVRAGSAFKDVIGSSEPMLRMFELIEKVIHTPTTVLIQGETGTGKELIARVIHYNGPLKDHPFVAENCGALPEGLLESELFGHIKGSFTGAISNKKGLFEMADGGTIFLDEIGEMSPLMQIKLLRVLQEGQFRPVGDNKTRKINVRVIAATNKNLSEEIAKGNFREDLYYRINVFQITPPPLRERREDIPSLASHFLKKYASRLNKPTPSLPPHTIDLLTRYNWPGNVRELENEMERALTMAAGGDFLHVDLLSTKIKGKRTTNAGEIIETPSGSLKDAVKQVEKRMIFEALNESGGNRSQAAKSLGLSRQGLLNKISALNIQSN